MSTVESKTKNELIVLLRELVRQFQAMDERQLSDVMDGTAKLEVRIVPSKRSSPSMKRARLSDDELSQLGEALRSVRTREEGNLLLDEKVSSKEDLTSLARQMDIPIQKTDTAEQIRTRIIESTIGFRLRSAAIQGIGSVASEKRAEPAK